MAPPVKFDEIGNWSEVKLEIIRKYAAAYSKILSNQRGLYHLYIDAFAGAGVHIARATGALVPGSPLNVLLLDPPFREYHLIDIEGDKVAALRALTGDRPDVQVHQGDCNAVLMHEVFPRVRYEDYRRALCLLDPYGLHLKWEVIATAARMQSIEIFLNFPVMDMNRNVFWNNPDGVDPQDLDRMTAFWGDGSWRNVVYSTQGNLFGWEEKTADNETVAQSFRERLRIVAGFVHVPDPLPMRNSRGNTIYYLFFASQNPVGEKIIRDIFKMYR